MLMSLLTMRVALDCRACPFHLRSDDEDARMS